MVKLRYSALAKPTVTAVEFWMSEQQEQLVGWDKPFGNVKTEHR